MRCHLPVRGAGPFRQEMNRALLVLLKASGFCLEVRPTTILLNFRQRLSSKSSSINTAFATDFISHERSNFCSIPFSLECSVTCRKFTLCDGAHLPRCCSTLKPLARIERNLRLCPRTMQHRIVLRPSVA
jgi:hypothetical protein